MWPVVTDGVPWSVDRSLCLFITAISLARTTEPIEMPFGLWSRVGPRKHVVHGGAHCRHLVNMIQPSTFVGNAAFCQISFNTLHYRLCTVIL